MTRGISAQWACSGPEAGESSTEVARVPCESVCVCAVGEDAQRLLDVIYHLSSKANHNDFKGH